MKILILGSTGMLGQALVKESLTRQFSVVGMAEKGADYNFDIRDAEKLQSLLDEISPDVIINTVAIVSLGVCEENPGQAYEVNARPVSFLADFCSKNDSYLVHISTDHFYTKRKKEKHSENDQVSILNEYARSKFVSEKFALTIENSLVIRTNIVGFRNQKEKPTFIEWAMNALKNNEKITAFDDYFTSSIDVKNFSKILIDLVEKKKPTGVLNISSKDVSSKRDFILALARKNNFSIENISTGSVFDSSYQGVKRAESLGLNVSRARKLLGSDLPDLNDVINSLTEEYQEQHSEL